MGLCAGQTGVLAGLAWWALGAGRADDAMAFAVDASQVAPASGDSPVQLLADTAVRQSGPPPTRLLATSRPSSRLAEQRSQSLSYGSLISFTDGPDVDVLAASLALQMR